MWKASSWLLYEMTYWLSLPGLTWAFNYRYEGGQNIPLTGPVLILANHQSFLDPLIVGSATRRHLCFLARKTLFRNRLFASLIDFLNAVPVDQEGVAKEGLKTILDQLKAGRAVLMFPEGERTRTGEVQPLKPGVLLLIKRLEVPIVPVGIAGAFDALPRTRKWPKLSPFFLPTSGADIAVSVSKPISAERYRDMPRQRMLTELQEELKRAKERAERLRRRPASGGR
ncbi:MAG: lysophospholipid acyltransferase family protein [Gemmataceae bacterium]